MAMNMRERLQHLAMQLTDTVMAAVPRRAPEPGAIRKCKIVSHRGQHDNKQVMENTLPAFRLASSHGVWGIECDIRWTADLVPIIAHDPDARRVFGRAISFCGSTLSQIRTQLPQVPSLSELVAEFGGNTHLMLELKAEHFPRPEEQRHILRQQLSPLTPGRDYHLLALNPELFRLVDFVPRHCCLPVSELATRRLSRAALAAGYGGLLGHFLLLTNRLRQRHALAGQRIGTGFVASRNCLFRELNRGVEWVFSNDAVKLQRILDELSAATAR